MEMRNLSSFVEAIKSSTDLGRPLSPSLCEAIAKRDRTVCIAEILVQSLWNGKGLSGWVDPDAFKEMVRYIWHHVPDFFVEDDSRRIINEDIAQWNQEYLDLQRNFLRHNFSLRRLCHLVMVYEYLHGAEAAAKRPSPPPSVEAPRSASISSPQLSRTKRSYFGGAITVGCLILIIVVSTIMIKGRTSTPSDPRTPLAVKDNSTEQVNVAKKSVSVKTELVEEESTAKAPFQDELKEPTKAKSDSVLLETDVCKKDNAQPPKSNDVENASIALPELALGAEKAPVHQSKAPVGKE